MRQAPRQQAARPRPNNNQVRLYGAGRFPPAFANNPDAVDSLRAALEVRAAIIAEGVWSTVSKYVVGRKLLEAWAQHPNGPPRAVIDRIHEEIKRDRIPPRQPKAPKRRKLGNK